MSYEVIEKNEYGVLVKNTTNQLDCTICKFEPIDLNICIDYCGGGSNKYYLTDQEAAKLEAETTPETFTINDMYVESKLLFDCQDELKDLQIENDQLKERIKELDYYLEENIKLCKEQEDHFKSIAMEMSAEGSGAMKIAYQNVKEFIKNQK